MIKKQKENKMNTLQIFGMLFFIGACAWIVARNVIKHIDYRFKELQHDINIVDKKIEDAYAKLIEKQFQRFARK